VYAPHRLRGGELAGVEEHLLVCPWCQGRLEETEAFVRAMQGALRKLEGPWDARPRRGSIGDGEAV